MEAARDAALAVCAPTGAVAVHQAAPAEAPLKARAAFVQVAGAGARAHVSAEGVFAGAETAIRVAVAREALPPVEAAVPVAAGAPRPFPVGAVAVVAAPAAPAVPARGVVLRLDPSVISFEHVAASVRTRSHALRV